MYQILQTCNNLVIERWVPTVHFRDYRESTSSENTGKVVRKPLFISHVRRFINLFRMFISNVRMFINLSDVYFSCENVYKFILHVYF